MHFEHWISLEMFDTSPVNGFVHANYIIIGKLTLRVNAGFYAQIASMIGKTKFKKGFMLLIKLKMFNLIAF